MFDFYAADIDQRCVSITAQRVPLKQGIVMPGGEISPLIAVDPVDTLVCSHVLEHTSAPGEFISNLMKVIKPRGHLLLAVPNPVRPDVILGNLLHRHYVNRGHACTWDRSHWMNFLENIMNLRVVEYTSDFVPLPVIHRLPGIRLLQVGLVQLFPWFGFSNIAVIQNGNQCTPK